MRPSNEMSKIEDYDCFIVSETLVRFTFNLTAHPELRNSVLVKRCMTEYVGAYPLVTGWAGKIAGNALVIDVTGNINPKYYGK